MEFTKLTRKHGIKIPASCQCSVEECSLAVGEVLGHRSIKSAARMNSSVVIFVDAVEKANKVIESGVVINGRFVSVSPLATPTKRVIISNIPPFISDDLLLRELSRHGKVVSPVRKLAAGCRSPLLKHVVSHRRQVHMILNKKDEELNLVFSVKVEDFDYVVFVTSETLKCFSCGEEGHLARACPGKIPKDNRAQGGETGGDTQGGETGGDTQGGETGGDTQGGETGEDTQGGETRGDTQGGEVGGDTQAQKTQGGEKEKEVEQENSRTEKQTQSDVGSKKEVKQKDSKEEDRQKDSKEAAGAEQTGLNMAGRAAEDILRDSDEDMMTDETGYKVPALKRKVIENSNDTQTKREETRKLRRSQKMRLTENESSMEEEGDSQSYTGSQQEKMYTVKEIRKFLQITKNMKHVKYEEYFSDKELLLFSIRAQMRDKGNGGFVDTEIFRLKKIVLRLKNELFNDDE